MENPFQNTNIDTLKEAFPTVDASVINDVLYSAQGDLNIAFDMLDMNSSSVSDSRAKPLPQAPPLPVRRSSSINNLSYSSNTSNANKQPHANRISQTNPFIVPVVAKPLTVREELAQWRQDLREESRQRATAIASSSASISNLPFTNIFKSNSSRASLNHERNNNRSNNTQAHASYQRPLPPRPLGSLSGTRSSASTPNVNYQSHGRSNSHPNDTLTPLSRLPDHDTTTTVSHRPELPSRRRSNISATNPFYVSPVPPSTTQQQQQQQQQQPQQHNYLASNSNYRSSSENDIPSFNPFEEPELPPPAYSEIQRDTVVNLT
ncbi:hypothetical protein HMPREF1544_05224 [Mucor circinelloides 1006PhL]|uniref:CUE domain-containing protein n=1 Tax=Mucor circinelloides f. circinelloides (strain 1006PhL) TaxID=1220926 RepID=S2JYS8_MUCC1|nr:hypothetical protein HMPREF1544_05224 [Mucor circinelloides 1006PhL]